MPCFGKNNCRSQREQPIKTTEWRSLQNIYR
jgi:hypothetical protein